MSSRPRPGSSRKLRNLPQTPWQLLGLRGNPKVYMAVTGHLECCHVHPVTATHIGGRRQDVGPSLPGCRPGVGRASTDLLIIDRYSDGARPYVSSVHGCSSSSQGKVVSLGTFCPPIRAHSVLVSSRPRAHYVYRKSDLSTERNLAA